MPVSTISVKGQITLPISFRRKLGIKPHDRLVMQLEDDGILVKPAPDFFQFKGFLGKALPQKEEARRMRKALAAHVKVSPAVKTVFVDSNVFLRFYSTDDAGQHEKAAHLFRQAAAGKVALIAGPPVLFEIAWTLRTAYQQPRAMVLDVLSSIGALPGLKLLDARLVAEAIALARHTHSDFSDAYIVAGALAAGADQIASFNRAHFERLAAKLADL